MFGLNKLLIPLKTKKFLLISHELTNTGAPRALLNFARTIKEIGASVYVITLEDGELKSEFIKAQIPVLHLSYKKIKFLLPIICLFPIVICNTIITFKIVYLLQKYKKNVFWWTHEAQFLNEYLDNINERSRKTLLKTLNDCKHLFCVSEYSANYFKKYNSSAKILKVSIEDKFDKKQHILQQPNNKKTIVYVGEVIPLKGQDIFIDYFNSLPQALKDKYEVKFVGRLCNKAYHKELLEKIKDHKNFEFIGNLSHSKTLEIIVNSDIFALLSRGDSFSIATAEALMMNKPVIISENVGIAPIIETEFCGKIIKNKEEFCNLFEKIDNINFNSPRETFLKNFSSVAYKHYLQDIFKQYL